MGHLGVGRGTGWCRRRKGWGYAALSRLLYCDAQPATEAATVPGLDLYLLVRTPWIPFLHPLVIFSLISYSEEAEAVPAHAPVTLT